MKQPTDAQLDTIKAMIVQYLSEADADGHFEIWTFLEDYRPVTIGVCAELHLADRRQVPMFSTTINWQTWMLTHGDVNECLKMIALFAVDHILRELTDRPALYGAIDDPADTWGDVYQGAGDDDPALMPYGAIVGGADEPLAREDEPQVPYTFGYAVSYDELFTILNIDTDLPDIQDTVRAWWREDSDMAYQYTNISALNDKPDALRFFMATDLPVLIVDQTVREIVTFVRDAVNTENMLMSVSL